MQKRIVMMLLVSAINSAPTFAADATCEEKLSAANDVISSCDKAIESLLRVQTEQDTLIKDLKEANGAKQLRISDLEEASKAWYKNPAITIPLGIAAGALGVFVIKNRK